MEWSWYRRAISFPWRPAYVPDPRRGLWGAVSGKGSTVKRLKMQGYRVLLILSALASSALVLEAGQRWK